MPPGRKPPAVPRRSAIDRAITRPNAAVSASSRETKSPSYCLDSRFFPRGSSTSMHGVSSSVSPVAKVRPPAMALESWVHHWVEGAPTPRLGAEQIDVDPQHHGQQAQHRGHRGEQHRPQAQAARLQGRLEGAEALPAQFIVGVDQHDIVVHHDSRQGDDAHAHHHDAEEAGRWPAAPAVLPRWRTRSPRAPAPPGRSC